MNELVFYLFGIITAYLIGSIPTGYLVARFQGIADIRNHGSGNIGATNVARSLGKGYFFLILLLDAAIAFLLLYFLSKTGASQPLLIIASAALILGNAYSCFLGFKGGKGVATSLGILLALNPLLVVTALSVFLPTLYLTKTMGIASCAAALSLPLFAAFFLELEPSMVAFASCMAVAVCYLHTENIQQYLQGK